MADRVKHYFVADVHLGLKLPEPHAREQSFVDWLDSIAPDAAALYLLGDIFDFWWEYKHVVPKGYVRVLGRLAQLADSGVAIHYFRGNHDQWSFGYLEKEVGMQIHDEPFVAQIGNRHFCLGHGDSLCGVGGKKKVLRKMFASKFLQRCFGAVHPRWGVWLGHYWSARHRIKIIKSANCKIETTSLIHFASTFPHPVDYFVFGHLHTPVDATLPNKSRLLVLDEWMPKMQYALFNMLDETFFVHSHTF